MQLIHHSIQSVHTKQQTIFSKCIRYSFMFAGVFWLILYAMRWFTLATTQEFETFRVAQTPIYFLLLTLWGSDYLRQAARLRLLISISNQRSVAANTIELSEIPADKIHLFGVLFALSKSARAYIVPTLNIVVLTTAIVLIVLQYSKALMILFH